jgi:hypothetical protein
MILHDKIKDKDISFLIDIKKNKLQYNFEILHPDTLSFSARQDNIFFFEKDNLRSIDRFLKNEQRNLMENISSHYNGSDSNKYIFIDSNYHIILNTETMSKFDIFSKTEILKDFAWFPNSYILFFSAVMEDSNNDKRIDWEDNIKLVSYDNETGKYKILNDNIDKFYGINPDGNYLFYKKGKYIYKAIIQIPYRKLLKNKHLLEF